MKSAERFTPEVKATIKAAIEDAEGQEVLFYGKVNSEALVHEIDAAGRGNEASAPALFPHMESGDVVIHNHPSGVLRPSDADLQVASQLGNQGIGFYIIDNRIKSVYCVSEPLVQEPKTPLAVGSLSDILRPGGVMSSQFPSYESRDPQIAMLEAVGEAFNEHQLAVIEAGTGVGKSLAYLLPAASWALQNRERVIISTATINLQQQLLDKDIPLAEKLLGKRVDAKLVKGRGNYVCLRRLEDTIEEMALFSQEESELEAIKKWAEVTDSGSRDDLSFFPSQDIWSRVCSESDACMGLRCPHRDRCFVLRSRREAAASNLLVVNHHLLFSDLAARVEGAGFDSTAVLPPTDHIIFDEAHSLEKSATSFFSERYNKFILFKQLRRIYSRRHNRAFGLALQLQKYSDEQDVYQTIPTLVQELHREADKLDDQLLAFLDTAGNFWIKQSTDPQQLAEALDPIRHMRTALNKLLSALERGMEKVDEKYAQESEVFETGIVIERLASQAKVLGAIERYDEQEDAICWIEKGFTSKREPFCTLIRTPLEISELMQEAVYEPHKTVIATSATLTVRKQFQYWLSRVGLNGMYQDRLSTVQLESPFHYRKQVLLAVPNDAPQPNQPGYQEYVSAFVAKSLSISEGSALVLFTSYRMLQETHAQVAPGLEERGISVLKQGGEERSKLMAHFHSDISSVLFATDSFWEGVDAPGEALRLVLICRLPFAVPTDPVVQARMEAVEKKGGNSFMNYSLPQAAMKLRQGFGRLMRRKTDRGVVCILDSRIIHKSYGKILLGSLPATGQKIESGAQVLQGMEDFFYLAGASGEAPKA